MYDSSGTAPSGLLSGTTISLGDFDQCLRVAENGQFDETQYCLLTLKARRRGTFNYFQFDEQQESQLTAWEREHLEKWLITDNKVPIVVGLCLPALCNEKEKDIIAKGGKLVLLGLFQKLIWITTFCSLPKQHQIWWSISMPRCSTARTIPKTVLTSLFWCCLCKWWCLPLWWPLFYHFAVFAVIFLGYSLTAFSLVSVALAPPWTTSPVPNLVALGLLY